MGSRVVSRYPKDCPVLEITGGIDFEEASIACLDFLEAI